MKRLDHQRGRLNAKRGHTLAICASKLQHYGRSMTETDANKQLGEQFLGLSERCHQQINAHGTACWRVP